MELSNKQKNPNNPISWVEMLQEMLDKEFLIMGKNEKFLYYEVLEDEVILITNSTSTSRKKRVVALQELPNELKKWMPVDNDNNVSNGIAKYQQQISGSVLSEVKDILLSNIKSVQADKNYIPQAIEVRETADKIIDLAKVEIDYMRMLNKLNS